MDTVFFDTAMSDEIRRRHIYSGGIFVFSPRPSTVALCEFAQSTLEGAFYPLDPRNAQESIPVEEYVAISAPLKPAFIHHRRTQELLRAVVEDFKCDLNETYVDVPRLRMVTHGGYLTSGIGYVHHPHRDTWYSAPMCQLNWWLPIYPIERESAMAFHPRYWNLAVKNGSPRFNYYVWNADGRKNAALHIKSDTREQPRAEQPIELEPQLRIVCPPGGVILFSAAQMHSTVANTSGFTRYSIDFRTVNIVDAANRVGAANIDSTPTGTSLRDFHRGSDGADCPDSLVALHDARAAKAGDLVFRPSLNR